MNAWAAIVTNYRYLMETAIAYETTNLFHETPSGPDITKLPNSIFNGAYSIAVGAIPTITTEVNATIVFEYQVLLRVGFIINQEDKNDPDTSTIDKTKSEYHNAVNDCEAIVRKLFASSTYQRGLESDLDGVTLQSVSAVEFLEATANYATVTISALARKTIPL